MMQWKKLGLIFTPDTNLDWTQSHAMIPTPIKINNKTIRVYLTFCDKFGLGRPGFIDVSLSDPSKVINYSKKPLLELGSSGSFDESGVLVCSVVRKELKTMHMYYVGFELGTKIRYRLLTGLALSYDNGNSFKKILKVPVLERSTDELYFRCGPFCIYEDQKFKLYCFSLL